MEVPKDIRFTEIGRSINTTSLLGKTKGDKVIWALVILLALVSLLAVYSATGSLAYKNYQGNTEIYLFKQVAFIIIGVLVIYMAHLVNYTVYSKVSTFAFILVIPLLIYTLLFGTTINQGSRWIKVPVINMTVQTSDIAKLVLFMYLARVLSRRQEVIKDFKKGFLPLIIPIGGICLLIAPANLSTAMLLGASCMMLLFIGRVSIKHLLMVVGVVAIPVVILVLSAIAKHATEKNQPEEVVAAATAKTSLTRWNTWVSRVESFMYGGKAANDDDMYQSNQAKIAIARGGFVGEGPGNSLARDYLPQAYNDFIYAIIIEEYGFLGAAFIVFVYLVFLYRCIRIFKRTPYAFGSFLSLGLGFSLAIQAIANMAVAVGLFPVTGVTLPLVSMGGSSFIFTCLAIGIVLSVARNAEKLEQAVALAAVDGDEKNEEDEEPDTDKNGK